MISPPPLKAMILAAGLGTRLKPLTDSTPKALLLIAGQPLITYQLRLLAHYGCREVVINLHWLGHLIEKELGTGKKFGMKIIYSYEEQILGTGGGILKASPSFGKSPFIVMNSDILIDVDLGAVMAEHYQQKCAATLVLAAMPGNARFTPVWGNGRGRILQIGGLAPTGIESIPPQMFTGVQVVTRELLDYLPKLTPSCIIRNGIEPALKANAKISSYSYQGYFQDVGTLDRYRAADRSITSKEIRLSYL